MLCWSIAFKDFFTFIMSLIWANLLGLPIRDALACLIAAKIAGLSMFNDFVSVNAGKVRDKTSDDLNLHWVEAFRGQSLSLLLYGFRADNAFEKVFYWMNWLPWHWINKGILLLNSSESRQWSSRSKAWSLKAIWWGLLKLGEERGKFGVHTALSCA